MTNKRIEMRPIADIKPPMCAWDGCDRCQDSFALTDGWVSVVVFDRDPPGIVNFAMFPTRHDVVFCPEHASTFELCLKPAVRR